MFNFSDCIDAAQIKSKYRKLVFTVHPDMHPQDQFSQWNEKTQILNAAYLDALKRCDGQVTTGDDGKDHTYRYNSATEETLIDAVARAIRAKLPDHVTVSIVGIYIWIENMRKEDTEARAILKGDGEDAPADRFYWHSKRMAWYWKPKTYRSHYNRRASLDDLKGFYGSRTVDKEERQERPALS